MAFDDDQVVLTPLFVTKKKVFALATRDVLVVLFGFFTGVDGRVSVFGEFDGEVFEVDVDLLVDGGHGACIEYLCLEYYLGKLLVNNSQDLT